MNTGVFSEAQRDRSTLFALMDFDEPEPLEEFDDDDIEDDDDERNALTDTLACK